MNVGKHRFDFTTASQIWDSQVVERVDDRFDYGETRVIATGEVDGSILVVIYTQRGEKRRIISARKANLRETELFRTEIARRSGTAQH